MEDEIIDLKAKVKNQMLSNLRTRNDDKYLILMIWKEQGLDIILLEKVLHILYNPESIIRVRAEIQNMDGILLPTDPKVLIKRKIREVKIRNYYSGNKSIINEWETLRFDIG